MSHPINTVFLEQAQETFVDHKDGQLRSQIISDLKERGFEDAAEDLLEGWYDERKAYLENANISKHDVIYDDDGEFYMSEIDNGNPGEEGYNIAWKRVRMPTYLDIDLWMGNQRVLPVKS